MGKLTDNGLTIEEFDELYKYIMENHSWDKMYDLHHSPETKDNRIIKYIESSMDSRDGRIWKVTFNQVMGIKGADQTKSYTFRDSIIDGLPMKDRIYKWLKGEKEREPDNEKE